ncbi:hypothetical protein D5S18_10995 [Nocardia panacis]|uniref:Uncharacterized protein n=1 Tax=Nocardia panacis TaxID=2340916 RepID=A0A3A4KQC4_9NOCA|nr:hypothetical protein [Nocardia panacis]RJO76772.1 hypothetical protein D5S18_10995 [Nocardia panacis]
MEYDDYDRWLTDMTSMLAEASAELAEVARRKRAAGATDSDSPALEWAVPSLDRIAIDMRRSTTVRALSKLPHRDPPYTVAELAEYANVDLETAEDARDWITRSRATHPELRRPDDRADASAADEDPEFPRP